MNQARLELETPQIQTIIKPSKKWWFWRSLNFSCKRCQSVEGEKKFCCRGALIGCLSCKANQKFWRAKEQSVWLKFFVFKWCKSAQDFFAFHLFYQLGSWLREPKWSCSLLRFLVCFMLLLVGYSMLETIFTKFSLSDLSKSTLQGKTKKALGFVFFTLRGLCYTVAINFFKESQSSAGSWGSM